MNSEKIIVVTLNLKYEFKTGVKKELNLYNNITAVITEIKSPGRLCQLKYQKLVAELRWSLCKYYRECSDDFLKEKWWSFSCIDCPQEKKNNKRR